MITRREFGALLPAAVAVAQQVKLKVAVVGAGVFGTWIAHQLQSRGCSVTVFDQYGPANTRASSGGETRMLRVGYGPSTIYSQWAMRSHQAWLTTLHAISRPDCYRETGVLWLFRPDDPYGKSTITTLAEMAWPFQELDRNELHGRYPMIQLPSRCTGVLETKSGVLLAREAVRAIFGDFVKRGGTFVQAAASWQNDALVVEGKRIEVDRIVFACGPWLPKVLPNAVGDRIRPTRQEVMFFGPKPGDNAFTPGRLPAWIDFTDRRIPYGFPDLEARGFKIAFDRHGRKLDPDREERIATNEGILESRQYLALRFPEIARGPLVESRVCQYENTVTGDFIIDCLPDNKKVLVVGGGSGHGFKHGPAVGEHVAAVLTGQQPLIARFKLPKLQGSQPRDVH